MLVSVLGGARRRHFSASNQLHPWILGNVAKESITEFCLHPFFPKALRSPERHFFCTWLLWMREQFHITCNGEMLPKVAGIHGSHSFPLHINMKNPITIASHYVSTSSYAPLLSDSLCNWVWAREIHNSCNAGTNWNTWHSEADLSDIFVLHLICFLFADLPKCEKRVSCLGRRHSHSASITSVDLFIRHSVPCHSGRCEPEFPTFKILMDRAQLQGGCAGYTTASKGIPPEMQRTMFAGLIPCGSPPTRE